MSEQGEPIWDANQLIVAEYGHLRDEIIKRTELQPQVTAVTVVAFGTVVSVGVQVQNAAIILIYPLLSLILGISWLHHAHLITRIAAYIRGGIEQRVGVHNIGWEHFILDNPMPRGKFAYWGMRAIFVVSSLLSIASGLSVASPSASTITMLVLGFLTTIATGVIFYLWREPSPEMSSRGTRL